MKHICKIFAFFFTWTFSFNGWLPVAKGLPVEDTQGSLSKTSDLTDNRNDTNSEDLQDLILHVESLRDKNHEAEDDDPSTTTPRSHNLERNPKQNMKISNKRQSIEEKIASWLLKSQNKHAEVHKTPEDVSHKSKSSSDVENPPLLHPQTPKPLVVDVSVDELPKEGVMDLTLDTSKSSVDDSDMYDQYYYYYYEIDDDDVNLVDENDNTIDSKKIESNTDNGDDKVFKEQKSSTESDNSKGLDNVKDNKKEDSHEAKAVLKQYGSTAEINPGDLVDTTVHSEVHKNVSQSKELGVRIIIPVHSIKQKKSEKVSEGEKETKITKELSPQNIVNVSSSQTSAELSNGNFSVINGNSEEELSAKDSHILPENELKSHIEQENKTDEDEFQSSAERSSTDNTASNETQDVSKNTDVSDHTIAHTHDEITTKDNSSMHVSERDSKKKLRPHNRSRDNIDRGNESVISSQDELPRKITLSLRKRNESFTNGNLTEDSSTPTNTSLDAPIETLIETESDTRPVNKLIMKGENSVTKTTIQIDSYNSDIGSRHNEVNETTDLSPMSPKKNVSKEVSLSKVNVSNTTGTSHDAMDEEIFSDSDILTTLITVYNDTTKRHLNDSFIPKQNGIVTGEQFVDLERNLETDQSPDPENIDSNAEKEDEEITIGHDDSGAKENTSMQGENSSQTHVSHPRHLEKKGALTQNTTDNSITNFTNDNITIIQEGSIPLASNETVSDVSNSNVNAIPNNTDKTATTMNGGQNTLGREDSMTSLSKSEIIPKQELSELHDSNITEEILGNRKPLISEVQSDLENPDTKDHSSDQKTSETKNITHKQIQSKDIQVSTTHQNDQEGESTQQNRDIVKIPKENSNSQGMSETFILQNKSSQESPGMLELEDHNSSSCVSKENEKIHNESLSNQPMNKSVVGDNDVTKQSLDDRNVSNKTKDVSNTATTMSDELPAKYISDDNSSGEGTTVHDEVPSSNHRTGSPSKRVVRTVGGLPYWKDPDEKDIPPVSAYKSQDFSLRLSKPDSPSTNVPIGNSSKPTSDQGGSETDTACPVGCQGSGFESSFSGGQAAVSAVMTSHFGPTKDKIIPFDLVLLDLADNYDNSTGMFICTIPGTYVISLYLMSHPGAKVNARIFINNRPIAALWADDSKSAGFYPSSSTQTIAQLGFGDQVYVMLVDGGYGDSWVHANYNAFTIFLLREQVFS